jgi:hypothetical protein
VEGDVRRVALLAPRYYQVPNKWWWMSMKNGCHNKMLAITAQMLFEMRLVKILGSPLRTIGSLSAAGLLISSRSEVGDTSRRSLDC